MADCANYVSACQHEYLHCCCPFSVQISVAVDTLLGELSCKQGYNANLNEELFPGTELSIGQILKTTIKVFLDMVLFIFVMENSKIRWYKTPYHT